MWSSEQLPPPSPSPSCSSTQPKQRGTLRSSSVPTRLRAPLHPTSPPRSSPSANPIGRNGPNNGHAMPVMAPQVIQAKPVRTLSRMRDAPHGSGKSAHRTATRRRVRGIATPDWSEQFDAIPRSQRTRSHEQSRDAQMSGTGRGLLRADEGWNNVIQGCWMKWTRDIDLEQHPSPCGCPPCAVLAGEFSCWMVLDAYLHCLSGFFRFVYPL